MTKRYALTDSIIKASRKRGACILTDGMGLFLDVDWTRAAGHAWRFAFKSPVTGKRNKLTLGTIAFDADGKAFGLTIAEARKAAQAARDQLEKGICPAATRDENKVVEKAAQELAQENQARDKEGKAPLDSFFHVMERLQAANENRLDPKTVADMGETLRRHCSAFGYRQIAKVTPADVAVINEKLTNANTPTALAKVRRFMAQVFEYGIELGLCELMPVVKTRRIKQMFDDHQPKHNAAIMHDKGQLRELLEKLNAYMPPKGQNYLTTKRALQFQVLVFQRPHQIVSARKEQFNLDAGTWTCEAEKMKGRRVHKQRADAQDHTVYLSRQAVAILRAQFDAYPNSEWVFPGQRSSIAKTGHINKTALGQLLNTLGFKGKQTAHGFRRTGRTMGEEFLKLDPLALEKALAHKFAMDKDRKESVAHDANMPGVYADPRKVDERVHAAQAWADWLDDLVKPRLVAITPAPAPLPLAA